MRIETCGAGEPVVFIHGWATNGRVFDSCVSELEAGYECHVLDLPGHGTASAGHWDVGFDDLVDAVADHVASLETPPRVVGWAMGAMIALAAAARSGSRDLVCIGTPSGGDEFRGGFEKMAERMVPDWPRFARSSVDAIVGDRVSTDMHRFLTEMMASTPLTVARRTILEVGARDPEAWVREIDASILFVHGSDDAISPLHVSERLAAAAKDGGLLVYEGSGHAPHLEDPGRFVADVRSFWGRSSG